MTHAVHVGRIVALLLAVLAISRPASAQIDLSGEWTVSMRLPLEREATVGVITRLTQDVFRRLDRQDPPRLRLVLIPQVARPRQRGRVVGTARPADRLSRAA